MTERTQRTAIDRLLKAAEGLATTIAETDALLQRRADLLKDPVVTVRPNASHPDDLVSLADVARRTGRHPEVLRRWCADGRLPGVRIGRSWWLRKETVALLQAHSARARPRLQGRAITRA